MVLKKTVKQLFLMALLFQANLLCLFPSHLFTQRSLTEDQKVQPITVLRDYFKKKGFKTGKIKIPELAVVVNLKENQFYRKEEGVKNVYSRINEIRREFGLPVPYPDTAQGYGWCGVLFAEFEKQKAYGYVVLLRKRLDKASRIYTLAHENGHFLWYIGEQEKIFQQFKNPGYIKKCITTNKRFAELCGWMGMKFAGYDLDKSSVRYGRNPENKKKENDIETIKSLVANYLE
jgi:hypothetical protein